MKYIKKEQIKAILEYSKKQHTCKICHSTKGKKLKTHYPFGKKSKGRSSYYCKSCGEVLG